MSDEPDQDKFYFLLCNSFTRKILKMIEFNPLLARLRAIYGPTFFSHLLLLWSSASTVHRPAQERRPINGVSPVTNRMGLVYRAYFQH